MFPDYDYHIWSTIYGEKKKVQVYETGYDYIEETQHYRETIDITFARGILSVQIHPKITSYKFYTRKEVFDIFSPKNKTFSPGAGDWGNHGIIPIPETNDFIFYITYGTNLSYIGCINYQQNFS